MFQAWQLYLLLFSRLLIFQAWQLYLLLFSHSYISGLAAVPAAV
jgi:hypothetical protein